MRDKWVDEVLDVGEGAEMRPGFDTRLRDELSSIWVDDTTLDTGGERDTYIPIEPIASPRRNRAGSSRRRGFAAAAVVLVIALGAVVVTRNGPDDDAPIGGTSPDTDAPKTVADTEPAGVDLSRLIGPTWVVSEVDGEPYTGPTSWFRLSPDWTITGSDGCNGYGGTYKVGTAEGTLVIGDLASEGQLCDEVGITAQGGRTVVESDDLRLDGRTKDGDDVVVRALPTDRLNSTASLVVGSWSMPDGGRVEFTSKGRVIVEGCRAGFWWTENTVLVSWDPSVPCAESLDAPTGRAGIATDSSLIVVGGEGDREIHRFTREVRVRAGGVDLVVSPEVTTSLDVEPYMTVPSDARTSGEPLIAVFPESIVVVRELNEEFEVPSLVAYEYDRATGEKTNELGVRRATGRHSKRPMRIFGSSDGTLYMQHDLCWFAAYVESEHELVRRADVDDLCGAFVELVRSVPGGLEVRGSIELETRAADAVFPTVDFVYDGTLSDGSSETARVMRISRMDQREAGRSWTVAFESVTWDGARRALTHLAAHRGGAAAVFSDGRSSLLAVLDADPTGEHEVYALGDWKVAGIDEKGAVFWRQSADDRGIEIARLPG